MAIEENKLCGLHTTYTALRMLGDDKVTLEEMLPTFPKIKNDGASLAEISDYFKSKGYFVRMSKISEKEILTAPLDCVFISLIEREGYTPHLTLKRKLSEGTLQTIDFPASKLQKSSKLDATLCYSLVVSRNEIIVGEDVNFPYVSVAVFLVVVLAVFFFKRKRNTNAPTALSTPTANP